MLAARPFDGQRELLALVSARVCDAYLRQPLFVDGTQDIVSVCRLMAQQGATNVLVRDRHDSVERLGMFTTTDLRDALLRSETPAALPVRDVARFDLVSVHPHSELFEALALMVRHRVHRLVVRDGSAVLGVLGQLDLLSFVVNHSHIVAVQIDAAESVADLRVAAQRIDALVGALHEGGIQIERIARLVNDLNARLFARAWSFVAPAALVADSCLLVMGSQGRGEQVLKTDQDNALLLRDGADLTHLKPATQAFSEALAQFGYPPCPGGIMLTQPLWCQPLASFRTTLGEWVRGADAEAPMRLAIFFDAAAVAGDAGLLTDARRTLDELTTDNDAFLARFARAADQFDEPGAWWTRWLPRRDEPALDLKKLGTFPVVHGVRALALQYQVRELGTVPRLQALVAAQRIDATLARDLGDALRFVMALKLTHQLRQRRQGEAPSDLVQPSALGALERDPLRESLAIVRRFRAFLREHFRLDAL
jgi:CBS domain-containing protein